MRLDGVRPCRRSLAPLLSSMLMLACAACAREEPPAESAPTYSEPSYATSPGGTVATRVRFTEIAAEAGIDFEHATGAFGEKWMPETLGSGAAFLDYDGDGSPDLLLVNSDWWPRHEGSGERPTQRLYRNLGDGRFEDRTAAAGLALSFYGMGAAVADYDGDGDPDIYLTAVGPNRLLRNDGGTFTDVTAITGVDGDLPEGPPAWSTGAAWVDVDLDGWLDLYVCNYVRWTPETDLFTTLDGMTKSYATPQHYEGESCRLYRNAGSGGRFADISEAAGVLNPNGKSLGVAVTDFNSDGWPDLVVANDTQRNFLYRNEGDGTFVDIAVRAGVAFDEAGRARAGMGIDVADLDGEGKWSIVIGNFAHEPLALFTRIGDDLFQDRAGAAGLSRPTLIPLTFGVAFADFDLDGALDIVAANGHIEPAINAVRGEQTFPQRPQLFLGDGSGGFIDASDLVGAGFREALVGRGVATADIDGDGDLDLLVTENGGTPRLFRNELPVATGIGIRLAGAAPNRDALGALVTVYADGRAQRRFVATGSSYLSQSALAPLLFGLGDASVADSLMVRWPRGGRITHMGPVVAGAIVTVQETSR
ncbi:MAG: CRTAC1 family protein [Gemmatimonadetes bacterium]|nr:CRTAC1 family protein [Gemmatimonadota bacterium]